MIVNALSVAGFLLAALAVGILISAVTLAYANGPQPQQRPRASVIYVCILAAVLLWAMAIQAASMRILCDAMGLLEDARVAALSREGITGKQGMSASALHAVYICREQVSK